MADTLSPMLRLPLSPRLGLGLLLAVLAALAYQDLLRVAPPDSLLGDTEEFLFVRTNTSPPIVLALAAWLLARRRQALRAALAGPGAPLLGGLLLVAAAAAHLWAVYVNVPELLVLSLMGVAFGAAALAGGRAALKPLLVPAVVLLFALPVPAPLYNAFVFPLQLVTAHYSAWLLEPFGIPAFVSGDRILLADKSFQVIEGCSGFRSIQTLTLVAILYVDLFYRGPRQAAVLIGIAPLLAFVLNGVRILTMMLNPYSEIVSVHAIQGIVVLLGGLGLLHLLDGALERWLPERSAAADGEVPAAAPSTGWGGRARASAWALGGVLAGLAAASLWLPRWDERVPRPASLPAQGLPGPEIAGFERSPRPLEIDAPFYGKAAIAEAFHRRYRRGSDFVDVFIGAWDATRPDLSPFSPKAAYPGSGWLVESRGMLELEGADAPLRVETLAVRRWTERRLVAHWTVGRQGLLAESLRALLALDRWRPRQAAELVVRLSTNLEPGPAGRAAAEARLRAFARAIQAGLEPLTGAGREAGKPLPKVGSPLRREG